MTQIIRERISKPQVYDHWTDSVRINKRFLRNLYEATASQNRGHFTNKDAYVLYWLYHSDITKQRTYALGYEAKDPEMQMNVRNQLCKMEHEGLTIRVKPGHYKWAADAESKVQTRVKDA
jgi:hypothetical protein